VMGSAAVIGCELQPAVSVPGLESLHGCHAPCLLSTSL
jgi:hypothetical protein